MSQSETETGVKRPIDREGRSGDARTPPSEESPTDDRLAWGERGEPSRQSNPLLYVTVGQFLWMLVTGAILGGFGLFSAELYFDLSFIGLLVNKVLFAPSKDIPRQWWVIEALTWVGFAILMYLIVLRAQAVLAAT